MILLQQAESIDSCRLVLRPNASMTLAQARMLVVLLGMMLMVIGLGFAAMGAWLVLPFSGGELLLLILALSYSMRKTAACEVITIGPDKIKIEQQGPTAHKCVEFSRYWARIDWVPGPSRRLVIGSHGQWVEVGTFLGEEEKQKLATALQKQASICKR